MNTSGNMLLPNSHTDHIVVKVTYKFTVFTLLLRQQLNFQIYITVKILKFGTPQTIAIIVLKIEKFDVTLH